MLYSLDVNKSKRSLEVRNEVIKMIKDKFDLNFGFWFNDLYKVKDGVVRRLKGGLGRVDKNYLNIEEFNKEFNKVKEFVDNLNIEGFDIKLNKRVNYGWYDYYRMKERGYKGNFLDYKKECIFNEGTLILKIKWNV